MPWRMRRISIVVIDMATRLVLLPYLQHWVPDTLTVRLLIIPRGSPIDPLVPNAPSFATANFVFDVHLQQDLGSLPVPGGSPALITVPSPSVSTALPLYNQLTKEFKIDPSPPTPVRPQPSTIVQKHLPLSYQKAVSYVPGRTKIVFTDDTYACARQQAVPPPPIVPIPPPPPKIPWGKVIGFLMRNPALAQAAGLIRTFNFPINAPNTLKNGGFIYFTLSPTSDAGGLLSIPDALKLYSTRIPALTGARDLFSPVLFPVVTPPPSSDYSELFSEIDDYDDGWAKAVHCAQPQQLHPLNESPDGTRPVTEAGIRIGWDDEQVTIWVNRQFDSATFDSPLGVLGYRIDARLKGTPTWHPLVQASGPLKLPGVDLGKFDGELMVEVHPIQLDAQIQGIYWLPSYYTAWFGPSLVGPEITRLLLSGGRDLRKSDKVRGVDPDLACAYGKSYDFRVRFMDHSGGGPDVNGSPIISGPNSIASIDFRRWIRPQQPEIVGGAPTVPNPPSLAFKRPLLSYPAVVCTGFYPNAVDLLIQDMDLAAKEHRDPALPDPDVNRVQIIIEVRGLAQDPDVTNSPWMPIVTTTRAFPADMTQVLTVGITWIDLWDVSTLAISYPPTGPLVLPTARDVHLRIFSLCKDDPAYFGAADVGLSNLATEVELRKESSDETKLFGPDLPSHRFNAFYFQPDPPINLLAVVANKSAGQANIKPPDLASRAAAAFNLLHDGFTMRSPSNRRVIFGCASSIRHMIGPDGASITFASQSDLALHWVIVIRLILNRDWSWDGLAKDGIAIARDGKVVGTCGLYRNVGHDAVVVPDRKQTDMIFFDAFEGKPVAGAFPTTLNPKYTVSWTFVNAPQADPPLSLTMTLPVTTPPTQVPQIVSAGIAMSPYVRSDDYSSTAVREKVLWIELASPPLNPQDRLFARVLRNAPDPLLTDATTASLPSLRDPELPIDPEPVRKIVEGQGDDRAGLSAMQLLIPSDSDLYWSLPLPPGLDANSLELFGFFTYELRVGHFDVWSTAQGRFGPPLRVMGVQHPPPPMVITVLRNNLGINVSAPYAVPVTDGVTLREFPRTAIWVLLYAQARQVDGKDMRNILVDRVRASFDERKFRNQMQFGEAQFRDDVIRKKVAALGFRNHTTPLSVLAVELLSQDLFSRDPLGTLLGDQRILRTSPLTAVPTTC